jgi:hypothetical protein
VTLAGSGPRGGSRTGGDRSRGMGELSTVALAGETIAEVLRVAAGDGVRVCGQLVQSFCERERRWSSLTVPGCSARVCRSLQLRDALLDQVGDLGVLVRVGTTQIAASVSERHIGVTVTGGGGAQVGHGDLCLTSSACGLDLSVVGVTWGLHGCRGVSRFW